VLNELLVKKTENDFTNAYLWLVYCLFDKRLHDFFSLSIVRKKNLKKRNLIIQCKIIHMVVAIFHMHMYL
jgi:hypothetical protein